MKNFRNLIIFFCLLNIYLYADRDLPDNNLSYPVLLKAGNHTASGFYLRNDNKFYFVTAKHTIVHSKRDSTIISFKEEQIIIPNSIQDIMVHNEVKDYLVFFGIMSYNNLIELLQLNTNNETQDKIIELFISTYNFISNKIKLTSYSPDFSDPKRNIIELNLEELLLQNFIELSNEHDVAIIEIGNLINKDEDDNIKFYDPIVFFQRNSKGFLCVESNSIKIFDDVLIGNEIFVFGYPTSIGLENIPQIDYNRPLLRKGIIAGKNYKNSTIIIDCPIYYGNSGGPVVEIEKFGINQTKFKIIGLIIEFIPFAEIWLNEHINIGTMNCPIQDLV